MLLVFFVLVVNSISGALVAFLAYRGKWEIALIIFSMCALAFICTFQAVKEKRGE